MTDTTDNAPERIWHNIDRRGKIACCPDAHVQPCEAVAMAYVEYRRADLPATDAQVMAHPNVRALEEAAGVADGYHQRALDWAKTVRGLEKHIGETDSSHIAAAIRAIKDAKP
jgi:hypothetical protein